MSDEAAADMDFKPESIDSENPGTLMPQPGGDSHIFELKQQSQQVKPRNLCLSLSLRF